MLFKMLVFDGKGAYIGSANILSAFYLKYWQSRPDRGCPLSASKNRQPSPKSLETSIHKGFYTGDGSS